MRLPLLFTGRDKRMGDLAQYEEMRRATPILRNQINIVPIMMRLTQIPWFERKWVIQEVALTTGPMMLMVGFRTVKWDSFQNDILSLFTEVQKEMPELTFEHKSAISRIRVLGQIRPRSQSTWKRGNTQKPSSRIDVSRRAERLQAILLSASTFKVTNPYDIFYSILGLVQPLPKCFKAQYDEPLAQVSHRYSTHLIHHTRSLQCLNFQESMPGTPSWVADWRTIRKPNDESSRAGRCCRKIGFSDDKLKLMVRGVRISKLVGVASAAQLGIKVVSRGLKYDHPGAPAEACSLALRNIDAILNWYKDTISQSVSEGTSIQHSKKTIEHFTTWNEHDVQSLTEILKESQFENITNTDYKQLAYFERGKSACNQLMWLTWGGLGITTDQRMMSVQRKDIHLQAGTRPDIVVLLEGIRRPTVLRPEDGGLYRFLGFDRCAFAYKESKDQTLKVVMDELGYTMGQLETFVLI